jgi:mycothiol synthase
MVRGVEELTTRAYAVTDAAAVTRLFNLAEESAGGHPGVTDDETTAMFETLARDPDADTRVVTTPDGTLVAVALVPTPPAGGFRVDLIGAVHPDWRGRGLGRELLRWQLDRAERIHGLVAPEAHWEAHAGVLLEDESTIRLFQRFGMTPQRYWFDMVAPTEGVPDVAPPDGLRVVTYSSDLEKEVYEAHMEAFLDHWGYQRRDFAEWLALSVRTETFAPELSRVAFDGDQIAGYVLSYHDAVDGWLYIGQVGTRRPWRRRGLAAALLAEVLGEAGKAGKSKVLLGVDADSPTGAVGVYERVGFQVDSRAVTYAVTELATA